VVTVEPIPAQVLTLDVPDTDVEAAEPESPFYREDIPLDYDTQGLLYDACGETGIRYELALAMIWRETTFRNVVGDGGESYGYMQVQPRWHAERMERLGVTDLMDPLGNFRVGCDYMAELLEKYELPEALTAYNTGSPGHNQYADDVIGYMEDLV
jgi:soluble lytic murein transglycosylase-like protein